MTSVSVEKDAVLQGLGDSDQFTVISAGVGPAAAAASTMAALINEDYGLVVSTGIAGGFVGQAAIGTLVVATEIHAADLGAQTIDGFLSLDELGFGSAQMKVDTEASKRLYVALLQKDLLVTMGPILSVAMGTGTEERAEQLTLQVPGASAEAMEGYGVAVAAEQQGLPVIELRVISNRVGPRNRSEWQIDKALDCLTQASTVLKEVLEQ